MDNLHWLFYNAGAAAGLVAGCLCAVLLMWTMRSARRKALRMVTIALMVCLAVLAVCVLGMKSTA